MNSTKIIIATAVIFILGSLLTGCAKNEKEISEIAPGLKLAAEVKKDVELQLLTERKENTVFVKLVLFNPSNKPITSAQTWLSFNPQGLRGQKIDLTKSPFTLTAPMENTFDPEKGFLKLGRGSEKPISDRHIAVAEVAFDVLSEGTHMINVYDYKPDLSGHASANVLLDGKPYNLLLKPKTPALIINSSRNL